MTRKPHLVVLLSCVLSFALSHVAFAAPVIFSDSGGTALDIQDTVDAFRAALGDPNNGSAPGPLAAGRREISWDGGGAAAPVLLDMPKNQFKNSRGAFYLPSTTIFSISGQPSPEFGNINPTYPDLFTPFSDGRLFAPTNSNLTEQIFFVPGPGTTQRAVTSGFGVVFTDVDLAGVTKIEYISGSHVLLTQNVPAAPAGVANGSLSFLGVSFGSPIISRVRITTGNSAFGPNEGNGLDQVAMDDFIFGEPQAVPEPATLLLLGAGLVGIALAASLRHRKKRTLLAHRP